ncbi:hypothetical protein JCM10908_006328 [Rhodotorula pacifica]|uniref:oxysterol-binding protein related protein OSH3 n=1 Tax=Rhodotorula pacifica TaxID=1495444 RepID=UPI003172F133
MMMSCLPFTTRGIEHASTPGMADTTSERIVMQGFMLKKKRKALQGYARRYFRLSESGSLSYAFNPNSPVRDSVSIPLAFISASRKHRTLDIDGGNAVYHCKCLSLSDFDTWATAMKEFINIAHNHRREENVHAIGRRTLVVEPNPDMTLPPAAGKEATVRGLAAGQELDRVYAALAKLSQPICDLELVAHELGENTQQAHTTLLQPPTPTTATATTFAAGSGSSVGGSLSTSPTQLHLSPLAAAAASNASSSTNSSGGGSGSKFRFLGKRSNSTSAQQPAPPASSSSSPAQLLSGPGVLRSPTFSSTSSSSPTFVSGSGSGAVGAGIAIPPSSAGGVQPQRSDSTVSHNSSSAGAASHPHDQPDHHRHPAERQAWSRSLNEAITALKATHAELIAAVQALPLVIPPPSSSSTTHAHAQGQAAKSRAYSPPGSPTRALARSAPYQRTHGHGHTRAAPSRATTIASMHSSRASFVSALGWGEDGSDEVGTLGGGGGEREREQYWFDAVPGEFVLEDEQAGAALVGEGGDGQGSPPMQAQLQGDEMQGEGEGSGVAAKEGTEPGEEAHVLPESEDEDSGDEAADATAVQTGTNLHDAEVGPVVRRKVLPHPVAGDEFSMLSMLRKNVGKDLSTISFPVTMNEPLSALQRLAEELEYSELLDRAAKAPKGSLERLMLVAVFAVSGAAGNKYRSSRKPFNPLLGETYECIRPEQGFRFISEKVSHHPPVLAFHSEATSRGWQLSGHVAPNQKFWGRSMEIFVLGDCSVRFLDDDKDGEFYSIRKPSSFVKNLVAGTKYIEIVGDLVVTCSKSKAQAVVSFKEGSTWGGVSTRNKIEGRVMDEQGQTRIELVGRWDDAVDKKEGKHSFTRLWQIADYPPNPERYYGFSYFTTTLNETTPLEAGLMAPTDSRLRPDQLALEHGKVDEAEQLKQVVEEKQRSKRKNGTLRPPRWFIQEDGDGGVGWRYKGGYFEAREKKAFEDPDIFC